VAPRSVRIARLYDQQSPDDGPRVLVDRLWPRGVARGDARLDKWLKEVAPSDGLRRWYGHDPERFEEFEKRYRAELETGAAAAALADLKHTARRGPLTALTAARDHGLSHVTVLAAALRDPR